MSLRRLRQISAVCVLGVIGLLIAIPRATTIEPSEGLIAFTSNRFQSTSVYTMRPDGSNETRVADGGTPSWSPDGRQIAFLRTADHQTDVYIMDADGTNEQQVIYNREETRDLKISLVWSPDGTKLAFMSLKDGSTWLVIVTLETGDVQEIDAGELASFPAWSPDSQQIVFDRAHDGQYDLFLFTLADNEITQLTDTSISEIIPDWSHDGTRILFTTQARDEDGKAFFDIYTIAADGSDQTQLIEDGRNAIWSPDDAQIAFIRVGDNFDGNLYLMDADGGNVRQITTLGDVVGQLSWQPAPQIASTNTQNETLPSASSSSNALSANGRIVFVSDRSGANDLYTMNVDGTDVEQLTDDSDVEVSPTWSPDGTRIAFSVFDRGETDLYVMDADGKNRQRLTTNPAIEFSPTWSPDGTQIAFASEREGESKIYAVTVETGVIRRIIKESGSQHDPAWSPDGRQIVFSLDDDDNQDIYVASIDDGDAQPLTTSGDNEMFPRWSPDGTQIVFQAADADDKDGSTTEIYVMDADGDNERRLTDNDHYDGVPEWSPDGTQILFTSARDGMANLYLMNPDGSDVRAITEGDAYTGQGDWQPVEGGGTVVAETSVPSAGSELIVFTGEVDRTFEIYITRPDGSDIQRLTENDIFETSVTWSPDGTKIAFEGSSAFEDDYDLYVMDADGTNLRQLTDTADFDEEYPSWSPDGTRIVYQSDERSGHEIYVMDADGSNVQQLTRGVSDNQMPSWTPDGTQIVFVSDRDGPYNIYLMKPDGSDIEVVTKDARATLFPKVSPDGTEIVYSRVSGNKYNLYLVNVDGSQRRSLYEDEDDRTLMLPAWSPDGTQILFTAASDDDSKIYVIDRDGGNLRLLVDEPDYVLYASWRAAVGGVAQDDQTTTTAPQDTGCRVTMTENLNLRETPQTGRIILVVPIGTETAVIARSEDDAWWKIVYDGQEGWVSRSFTAAQTPCDRVPLEGEAVIPLPTPTSLPPTPVPPTPTETPVPVEPCLVSSSLVIRLYESPSGSTFTALVPIGQEAEVTARLADSSWYKVIYGDEEGWVDAFLVDATGDCDAVPIDEMAVLPAVTSIPQPTLVRPSRVTPTVTVAPSPTVVVATEQLPTEAGPAGNLIVFASDRDTFYYLYVMNPDGSGQRRIANSEMGSLTPVWSPDGTKIAFSRSVDGNLDIYIVNADGSGLRRVTTDPSDDISPTWSPDGTRIAYTSIASDLTSYIAVINVDGRLSKRLSRTANSYDQYPSWSPDGTQIAFISGDMNEGDVYLMDAADGGNLLRLTFERHALTPAWSPDGTQIAFALRRNNNMDIYTMDRDGGDLERLTTASATDYDPSWSPDGTEIVYASRTALVSPDIYVVTVETGDVRRLTNDTYDDDTYPDWNPNPSTDAIVQTSVEATVTPTPVPATTVSFADAAGEFTFDYLSGSILGGDDVLITLVQGENIIEVYAPSGYTSVIQGQRYDTPLEELKFFVSHEGFTPVGPETDKTSFGKELAHVSIESPYDQKGVAFLINLHNGNRAVVLWLAPEDKTLSGPMLQSLVKIVSTIAYTGDGEAATPAPTATMTASAVLPTATITPTNVSTQAVAQGTVMDVVLNDPDLSTFATSIIAAGLLDELTSANGFQYTVFAPTNAAFDAMLSERGITKSEFLSDPALLTAILSYHLLPGKTLSADMTTGEMTTLSGARVTIKKGGAVIFVNDVLTITQDLEADNGVVYVINEVLIPPALRTK